MLLQFKRMEYTPPAAQAVWNACQQLRRTVLRLAALLFRLVTHSCQPLEKIRQHLAQLMYRGKPLDVAVVMYGTRRRDTLPEAARELEARMDIRQGLEAVKREMRALARAEGVAARNDVACDMARLARQIMCRRLLQTPAGTGGLALALLRPD